MKKLNFCTMIGNPAYYSEEFREYTDENMDKLKENLVDTVLVNIAFSRPFIDPVLIEHVVQSKEFPLTSDVKEVELRSSQLKARVETVHKNGLKAIGLFGIPLYVDYSKLPKVYSQMLGSTLSTVSVDQVSCIQSETTIRYYKDLISVLLKVVPLDGMLVYTYDEFAEVCDEDSDCPRCKDIPLEDRLPKFLNTINSHCKSINSNFELMWEPWELSASQVYLCMDALDTSITISCHSTLHEVYHANHPDIWLRNVGMIAKRQGRKFVVEMFLTGSGEDIGPIGGYPCPRLIFEQIKELNLLEGVTGIKEYFGLAMPFYSVNEEMVKLSLKNDDTYEENINLIAGRFTKDGSKAKKLIEMWTYSSQALLMAPWDMSWVLRFSNLQPYDLTYWGKFHFKDTMKTPWTTPSWLSNRRSYYLIVDNENNLTKHMWRDFDKRMKLSIDYANKALDIANSLEIKSEEMRFNCVAIQTFSHILAARRNYMNLCNLITENKKGTNNLLEIQKLIKLDILNAEAFIECVSKQDIKHYFDVEKSKEGLKFMKEILNGKKHITEYFAFA